MAEQRNFVGVFCKFCDWKRIADADLFSEELRAKLMELEAQHITEHAEACARHFEFSAGE